MIDHQLTDFTCPACNGPVNWAKINILRPDGFPDWRLDIWCECGEVRHKAIIDMAWADYWRHYAREARAHQNAILDAALGKGLHVALEDLLNVCTSGKALGMDRRP